MHSHTTTVLTTPPLPLSRAIANDTALTTNACKKTITSVDNIFAINLYFVI